MRKFKSFSLTSKFNRLEHEEKDVKYGRSLRLIIILLAHTWDVLTE